MTTIGASRALVACPPASMSALVATAYSRCTRVWSSSPNTAIEGSRLATSLGWKRSSVMHSTTSGPGSSGATARLTTSTCLSTTRPQSPSPISSTPSKACRPECCAKSSPSLLATTGAPSGSGQVRTSPVRWVVPHHRRAPIHRTANASGLTARTALHHHPERWCTTPRLRSDGALADRPSGQLTGAAADLPGSRPRAKTWSRLRPDRRVPAGTGTRQRHCLLRSRRHRPRSVGDRTTGHPATGDRRVATS